MSVEVINVLYDQIGFNDPHSGVTNYFMALLKNFEEVNPIFAMKETNNPVLSMEPYGLKLSKHTFESFFGPFKFRGKRKLYDWACAHRLASDFRKINDKIFEEYADKSGVDLVHLTGAHVYSRGWQRYVGKVPIVVTIHDLIPEVVNHNEEIREVRRSVLSAASQVICVSEYTRQDVIKTYHVAPDKIKTIHHGVSFADSFQTFRWGEENCGKYVLFVGRRGGYKNFNWFVEAIAPFFQEHQDLVLFCTGIPFGREEQRLLARFDLEERTYNGFVADEQMNSLYRNAFAFVYPSIYEGFGMPILDAFAARCPVLLPRYSCFPEIGGDAAVFYNGEEGLREELQKLYDKSDDERAEVLDRGCIRANLFTWKNAATATLNVYKEAITRFAN